MEILTKEADSLRGYLEHWTKAMAEVYWFINPILFDYVREEIVEEITKEFNQPNCMHLMAISQDSNEILGVLKVRTHKGIATLGRWEPAVPPKNRDKDVGEALLEKAFAKLQERHVSKLRCLLKFPFNQPEKVSWHMKLFQKCCFVEERPRGIVLQADLFETSTKTSFPRNIHLVDAHGFSMRELADFTQRAYMLTPEDRAVHQGDAYISNRENVLKLLEAARDGKMGFSPPECWRAAKLKGNVTGFVIAFMPPKTKYQPAHGVIAELGVFPEYRRMGIAQLLITDAFKSFKRHGCRYVLVGTPKINTPALNLYNKLGFVPVFENVFLQKIL